MKKQLYIYSTLLIVAFIFHSCEDLEVVEEPDFEVAFNTTVKVGEPVNFKINNAPDFLYFYSGDFQHQYKFKDRTKAKGKVTMSFLNSQKWGKGSNATETLSVWYSKDYDGSGTAEAVGSASWTEITDRFNISTLYDFTFQSSGVVEITDLADEDLIYFGFKYFSDNVTDRGAEWYFDDFTIKADVEGAPAPLTVANDNDPGFQTVDVQGIHTGWNRAKWYFDTGKKHWRMRGNSNKIVNEDWLITNAINLTKVSPDKGIALKTYSEKLESFTYTYTEAGTYTVTFLGKNETIHDKQEKNQEFTITVTD
ncbi:DUF5017 domain-containing protein [Maribacter sp.]|uniref:DUF5017 domain-containing protein n=1 Tax=Maribacter sp. TaxID=1897614 RepID=UPI0025B9A1E8|nr:DUF5017 domain-containing protein [Maribacter sp.]